jgi:nitrous oxidase accessory protein
MFMEGVFIGKIIILLLLSFFTAVSHAHAEKNVSIEQLITQAKPGQTVVVPSGVYKGPLTIDKSVILRAEPGAILEGNGTGNVLTIAADKVTVEGLTIRNSGQDVTAHDAGILIQGNDVIVRNNSIQNTLFGIHLDRSSACFVSDNFIVGDKKASVARRGNGIQITAGGKHTIERNQLAEVQDGVYFDQTVHNTVRQNTVKNSRYGYHVMFSDNNRIVSNVTEDSVIGAMVMSANSIEVQDNVFRDQLDVQGCGLFLYDVQNGLVKGNKLLNNTTGITMDTVQGTLLQKNLIAYNAMGVKREGDIEATHLTKNAFVANVRQIGGDTDWLTEVWSWQAQGNYWDDYKGWDFNKDGIGDGAYRMADDMLKAFEGNPLLGIFYAGPLHQLMDQIASAYPVVDEYPLMSIPLTE